MDLKEVRDRVREIAKVAADGEAAECKTDELFVDFVRHVAGTSTDPDLRAMARAVLRTKRISLGPRA